MNKKEPDEDGELKSIAQRLMQVQNAWTERDCFEMMETLMAKPKIFQKQLMTETDLVKLFQRLLFYMSEEKQMQYYELKMNIKCMWCHRSEKE